MSEAEVKRFVADRAEREAEARDLSEDVAETPAFLTVSWGELAAAATRDPGEGAPAVRLERTPEGDVRFRMGGGYALDVTVPGADWDRDASPLSVAAHVVEGLVDSAVHDVAPAVAAAVLAFRR